MELQVAFGRTRFKLVADGDNLVAGKTVATTKHREYFMNDPSAPLSQQRSFFSLSFSMRQ